MPHVTAGRENSGAIQIHDEDHRRGTPVVLVHGYLLDGRSREKQETALLAAGRRVISYDRRGSGASTRPSTGYDYATLTAVPGCATASREDFRDDLARITLPVLIVQGSHDQVMPPQATGNRLPGLRRAARHVVIPNGPHTIIWTHAHEVNQALPGFIRAP